MHPLTSSELAYLSSPFCDEGKREKVAIPQTYPGYIVTFAIKMIASTWFLSTRQRQAGSDASERNECMREPNLFQAEPSQGHEYWAMCRPSRTLVMCRLRQTMYLSFDFGERRQHGPLDTDARLARRAIPARQTSPSRE